MSKYLLVLCFGEKENKNLDENDYIALEDSCIKKTVDDMPLVPRMGERVFLGGNYLLVKEVTHMITERLAEVTCEVCLLNAALAYTNNKEGWNLDSLEPDGKEIFFKEVKRLEELWKQQTNTAEQTTTPAYLTMLQLSAQVTEILNEIRATGATNSDAREIRNRLKQKALMYHSSQIPQVLHASDEIKITSTISKSITFEFVNKK